MEQETIFTEALPVTFQNAGKGARFANLMLDSMSVGLIYMVGIGVSVVTILGADFFMPHGGGGDPEAMKNAMVWLQALYFTLYAGNNLLLEKLTGRSLGKFVTGTRVVNQNGEAISWGQAVGRFFIRLIPFEPFSIFFSEENRAWHDQWSNTYVVEAKSLQRLS